MRPHSIVVTFGVNTPFIFITDYFQGNMSVQCVPSGGATYTVEYTADDPNQTDPSDVGVTPVWFAFSAPMTGATSNQYGSLSNQMIRAIRITVTVAGSVRFVVVQASGTDGLAMGDPLSG